MLTPSIRAELTDYILDKIADDVIDNDNQDEWHHLCFNEGYYVTSHHEAKEWLKNHELDAFDAIAEVVEYEQDNFGEIDYDRLRFPDQVVNMLVYIYGQEVIHEDNPETIAELWDSCGGADGYFDEDEDEEEDEDED